jgi:hypothetical protein
MIVKVGIFHLFSKNTYLKFGSFQNFFLSLQRHLGIVIPKNDYLYKNIINFKTLTLWLT